MNQQVSTGQNALQAWVRELLHGPQQSAGDYFEQLRINIESSAPVRGNCHS